MTQIERGEDGFVVDAGILADAFGIAVAEIRNLMQTGAITSRCEKGVEDDEGRWRLVFSYGGRALRLTVDETGQILGRSRYDVPRPWIPSRNS